MTTISENFDVGQAIQLTEKEFRLISDLVYERFGINLTDKKKALVRGRLNSLVKSLGHNSFEQYYEAVVHDRTEKSLLSLVDRISTNHSFFFRETEHFDFLTATILPEICERLLEKGSRELRIWCAGCAAGEEPYTIAMVLREFFGFDINKWDVGILGTDISKTALQQAVNGIYTSNKVEAAPARYKKYFKELGNDSYSVDDRIKAMVLYKRLNFMREEFPFKGKFHVIFCRNVMIYFDRETRNRLIEKFHTHMHEDAYLFIGHSETLGRDTQMFRYVKPTVYKKW